MDTDRLISQGLRIPRLEDIYFEIHPVFFALLIISFPDLQGQADTIEFLRPLALEVDERGDDLLLAAVEVFLLQQFHHGLPQGLAGAGGDGALGLGEIGKFRIFRGGNNIIPGRIPPSCLDPSLDCSELFSTSEKQLFINIIEKKNP